MGRVIAIDGPAGSGKSTVAKEVARRLGYLYIDTGAMYRALTLKAAEENINLEDKSALIKLSGKADISLKSSGDSLKVYLDGRDVSREIRTMNITRRVKKIASIGEVRENMVRLQRSLGNSSSGAAMEGRDIGTVVFPDAEYKFYLDADFKTRVKRRHDELKEKGFDASMKEVEEDVRERDASDMTREAGPLKKTDESIVIDTTDMTVEEVVGRILDYVNDL